MLIAQAGVGTDQIGRFDLVVDDDTNSIVEWKWQLLPIDNNLAEPDPELETLIQTFKEEIDRKHNRLIGRLARKLSHPRREEETELGNLLADILAQTTNADVVLLGSGAIRATQLGPLVTFSDLKMAFPYKDILYKFRVTGAQLLKIFAHIMRPQNRIPGESQCYQVNQGVQAVYDDAQARLEALRINEQPVQSEQEYTLCFEGYHYHNAALNLDMTQEELARLAEPKIVTTSTIDVFEEYFSHHQNLNRRVGQRLLYKRG